MRKYSSTVLLLLCLSACAIVSLAQTDHVNAFTGKWKMNAAKSKYTSSNAPKSATVTIAPDGLFTYQAVGAHDEPIEWSHPYSVGTETPITGIPNGTIFTKLQGNTSDEVMKVSGKTVQTVHAVVSPGKKTITATITRQDEQGRSVHDTQVFEKQ